MTDLLQLDATDEGWSDDQLQQIKQLPHFKLFTGPLQAGEGPNFKTLDAVASSTIKDLHGDNMTMDCVRDMATQARRGPQGKGLTIFLNHKYSAPEDVAGRVIRADAMPTGQMDDDTGEEIWDLGYKIQLTNNNDRVSQMYRQVAEDDISLGISIGAYIQEYDYKDEDKGFFGGLIINKLLLVETSVVGIPANQRSWIQNGVMAIGKHIGLDRLFESDEPTNRLERRLWKVLDGKSEFIPVKVATVGEAGEETFVPLIEESHPELPDSAFACIDAKGRHYPHHTSGGAVNKALLRNALARVNQAGNTQCGKGHLRSHASKLGIGEDNKSMDEKITSSHEEEDHFSSSDAVEGTPEDATADTETNADSTPESEVPAEATPEPESSADATTETTDEGSTAETTEESSADNSAALEEAAPEIALSLKAGSTPSAELVLAALEHAAMLLHDVRAEKTALEAQVLSLTGERDTAIDERNEAAQILELVARSPLGRKTQFAGPVQSFRAKFAGIYDDGFLKLIDETE